MGAKGDDRRRSSLNGNNFENRIFFLHYDDSLIVLNGKLAPFTYKSPNRLALKVWLGVSRTACT